MEEEFYSIIKLVSGEEILSLISIDENNGDPLVILQNPITMKMIETPQGMHIKVKSWMELSEDDFFIVRPDKIITMTETKDEPSSKMGYISSVEEARKSLENLYNLKDTKES